MLFRSRLSEEHSNNIDSSYEEGESLPTYSAIVAQIEPKLRYLSNEYYGDQDELYAHSIALSGKRLNPVERTSGVERRC